MVKDAKQRLTVYTAPEPEAKATADAIALALNAATVIEAALSDDGDAPTLDKPINKLLSANEPAILVTHRRRLKAILKAIRAAKGNQRLKIVGHRPFFRNQALLVDPDNLSVDVVSIS
jgi:phosphohistidine phosphatase SixA